MKPSIRFLPAAPDYAANAIPTYNHPLNRERESTGPGSDLSLQLFDFLDLTASDFGLEVLQLVGFLGELGLDLLANLDTIVNVAGNALEVILAHSSAGHGWSTNPDTHGGKGRLVARSGVLVAGNVDLLKDGLNSGTVKGLWLQVEENHVVIGSTGDKGVVAVLELALESFGILLDLLLVLYELRGLGLLECDGKGGDSVVVGTTLVTGEDTEVDGTLEVV